MREKAKGAHSGDAGGAAGPAGSDAGHHPAKQAHQNAEENLDVHEVPPRCDQLPGHRPRRRGDPAYSGKVVRNDPRDSRVGSVFQLALKKAIIHLKRNPIGRSF